MQTNGAIFDLLLGIPQSDATGVQPAPQSGSAEPTLSFEQLLAQLALPGTKASISRQSPIDFAKTVSFEGLGIKTPNESGAAVSPEPTRQFSLLAEMLAAGAESAEHQQVIGRMPAKDDGVQDVNLPDALTETASDRLANTVGRSGPETMLTADHGGILEGETPINDNRIRELLALQPRPIAISETRSNTLAVGTYEILSVTPKGKAVEFTLKGIDPTAEPIRLSLPLETAQQIVEQAVQQQTAKAQVIPARVAIQQSGQPSTEITALLQKLNLKELTVRSIGDADAGEPESGDTVSDKQRIEFHGQPDGKRVVFDLTVPRRSLTVRTPVKAATPEMMPQSDVSEALASKPVVRTVLPEQAMSGKVAEPTTWPTRPFTGFEFKNQTVDARTDGEQWLQSLTSLRTSSEPTTVNLSQQLQTARFTLPDNIAQQYKGNGRSITIGIEPEQLGPARLHLSVTNHSLTARLTVESSAAKSIVEQSLEQLTQQLDRAGIKVDSITVQVAGGNTNTNMFEQRQQAAFNRARMNRRMTERIISQEMNSPTPTPTLSRPSYIGAGGVNVYA